MDQTAGNGGRERLFAADVFLKMPRDPDRGGRVLEHSGPSHDPPQYRSKYIHAMVSVELLHQNMVIKASVGFSSPRNLSVHAVQSAHTQLSFHHLEMKCDGQEFVVVPVLLFSFPSRR